MSPSTTYRWVSRPAVGATWARSVTAISALTQVDTSQRLIPDDSRPDNCRTPQHEMTLGMCRLPGRSLCGGELMCHAECHNHANAHERVKSAAKAPNTQGQRRGAATECHSYCRILRNSTRHCARPQTTRSELCCVGVHDGRVRQVGLPIPVSRCSWP